MASALRNFWRQFNHRNEGTRWLAEALSFTTDTDPSLRANVLYSAGEMAYFMGSFHHALEHLEEAVRLRRELGDRAGLAKALCYYGRGVARTASTPADYDRGKALMNEAIVQSNECGARWWAAWSMQLFGYSAWEHAELDLATTVLQDAEAILTELGESHALSHVTTILGSVLCYRGDIARGRELLEQSLAEARASRYCLDGIFEALYHLALLARLEGDQPGATQQAVEALITQKQAGNPAPLADSLELLGGLACDQGLPDRAATLFSAAATFRERLSLPMPPILRAAYERDLRAARRALGNDEFHVRWAEGLAMTDDQVIEYAARLPQPLAKDPSAPQLRRW
jgi:tetratricopeptide (TPR) repeat protein